MKNRPTMSFGCPFFPVEMLNITVENGFKDFRKLRMNRRNQNSDNPGAIRLFAGPFSVGHEVPSSFPKRLLEKIDGKQPAQW